MFFSEIGLFQSSFFKSNFPVSWKKKPKITSKIWHIIANSTSCVFYYRLSTKWRRLKKNAKIFFLVFSTFNRDLLYVTDIPIRYILSTQFCEYSGIFSTVLAKIFTQNIPHTGAFYSSLYLLLVFFFGVVHWQRVEWQRVFASGP